jgi:hypothetical protein
MVIRQVQALRDLNPKNDSSYAFGSVEKILDPTGI